MIEFQEINYLASSILPSLIHELLPNGRREGNEWVAINPTRNDLKLGSFKINLITGKWSDFATNDKGGDIISLYAYIKKLSQSEAAKLLAIKLGVRDEQR
ncbi:MAG: hypothetical protein HQK51_21415 [Oligoflexia bacterium]|nr:hypothetical protein [Oligoflexia bacterium]